MNAVRVPWSHASFLVYLGGITILAAVLSFLSIESSEHGAGRLVGWSALAFGILAVLAFLSKRNGRLLTAGLYALSVVAAFVVFFGALLSWFGWLGDLNRGSAFGGFRFWLFVLELSVVVAAAVALRIFRFPLLVFVVAASAWFFVTDLISGGGDWSASVTIAYGLALLGVAVASDSEGPRIYGFWLHVVAGLTIGGGLLWFFHEGDWDWVVSWSRGARLHPARGPPTPLELGRPRSLGAPASDHALRREVGGRRRLRILSPRLPPVSVPRVQRIRADAGPRMGRSPRVCPPGARLHRGRATACAPPPRGGPGRRAPLARNYNHRRDDRRPGSPGKLPRARGDASSARRRPRRGPQAGAAAGARRVGHPGRRIDHVHALNAALRARRGGARVRRPPARHLRGDDRARPPASRRRRHRRRPERVRTAGRELRGRPGSGGRG